MLGKIFEGLFEVYARRRVASDLNRLSDRELRDIGVCRSDIPRVVRKAYNK